MNDRTYYRDMLSPEGKRIYDALLKGLGALETSIEIPILDFTQLHPVMEAIQLDVSNLFFLRFDNCVGWRRGFKAGITPSYTDSAAECKRKRHAIMQIGKQIAAKIANFSQMDKEMYIVEYLASNITYGYLPGQEYQSYTVEGALLNHTCVCMGFTRAFNMMARLTGIKSILVEGRLTNHGTEDHCWNIVEINGRMHHLDVTACAGKTPHYDTVNLSDAMARKLLIPTSRFPVPACPMAATPYPIARSDDEIVQHLRACVKRGDKVCTIGLLSSMNSSAALEAFLDRQDSLRNILWHSRITDYIFNEPLGVVTFMLNK